MTSTVAEDYTRQDAIRVLGIAWDRAAYGSDVGDLPSNGTQGDIAFDHAVSWMERSPGLRLVLEAGIRALDSDTLYSNWIVTLYSGDRERCLELERDIERRFPADPEPTGMTPEEVSQALIADLHERYPEATDE